MKKKKIPGYSKYAISKTGVLVRIEDNAIMNWHKSGDYRSCVLVDDYGNRKSVGMHRALALAYIPMPVTDKKLEPNHINGIKDDNRLCNLEWTTRGENMDHAFRTGLANSSIVRLTNLLTNEETTLYSVTKACRFLKVHSTYFHEKHSVGRNDLIVKGYRVQFLKRAVRFIPNPKGVCARNIFTGIKLFAKTLGNLSIHVDIETKVMVRIIKNIKFDYPVNGWDIRVVSEHIEWPTYTQVELDAFKGVYFINTPVWVIDKNGNEKLFGSVKLAEAYTGTGERAIRYCIKNRSKCTRGFGYKKHVRKVYFNE